MFMAPSTSTRERRRRAWSGPGAGGVIATMSALAIGALALRPQFIAIGPLADRMQQDLGVRHWVIGLISTLPVLGMGLMALPSSRLAARFGSRPAIGWSLALLALAGILRSFAPGAIAIVLLTVPLAVGMGLANALLSYVVKERAAAHPMLATSLYAAGIQLGATASSALAVPIADAGSGWRTTLLVVSLAAALSLVAWLMLIRPLPVASTAGRVARLPWRSGLAWRFVALFVTNGLVYYGLSAWLPEALIEHGWSEGRAGVANALINAFALVASLALAVLGDRFGSRRQYLLFACTLLTLGTMLVILAPGGSIVWACVMGLGNGTLFVAMMTLPLAAADDPSEVAAIAGMMLGVGYSAAAAAPLGLGGVRDLTGSFSTSLWLIAAMALLAGLISATLSPGRIARGVARR